MRFQVRKMYVLRSSYIDTFPLIEFLLCIWSCCWTVDVLANTRYLSLQVMAGRMGPLVYVHPVSNVRQLLIRVFSVICFFHYFQLFNA